MNRHVSPLSVTPAPSPSPESARPLLWDLAATCRELSISRRTAERFMSAGRFVKPVRIGKSLRFRPADVLAWIDE